MGARQAITGIDNALLHHHGSRLGDQAEVDILDDGPSKVFAVKRGI